MQIKLSRAIQALIRTVIDGHRIFNTALGQELGLRPLSGAAAGTGRPDAQQEAADTSRPPILALTPSTLVRGAGTTKSAALTEAITEWVIERIQETYLHSQRMLKLLRSSNELAVVRQRLWDETHRQGKRVA